MDCWLTIVESRYGRQSKTTVCALDVPTYAVSRATGPTAHLPLLSAFDQPSTKSKVIGSVAVNQEVKVTEELNSGWKKIVFNDTTGFVYGKFFANTPKAKKSSAKKTAVAKTKVKKPKQKGPQKIDVSQAKSYVVVKEHETSV